jgi:hypothetical protein
MKVVNLDDWQQGYQKTLEVQKPKRGMRLNRRHAFVNAQTPEVVETARGDGKPKGASAIAEDQNFKGLNPMSVVALK